MMAAVVFMVVEDCRGSQHRLRSVGLASTIADGRGRMREKTDASLAPRATL